MSLASEGIGPDGIPGRFFGWVDSANLPFAFDADTQTWCKSVKSGDREPGAYWIGYRNDAPPTQSDLLRPDARRGTWVPFADGDMWSIVVPATLDRFPKLHDDGTLTYCADPAFNWLVHECDRRKESAIVKDPDDEEKVISVLWDDVEDFGFLARIIAVNYRVTPELICALNLITEDVVQILVAALMGLTLKKDEKQIGAKLLVAS